VTGTAKQSVVVSERLKTAIADLRPLQSLLLSDDLPACVLSDFRDALNLVRNAAWAAQQSVALKVSGKSSPDVVSLLAQERIRAAYQVCRLIQKDLHNDAIQFQKGQLVELQGALSDLSAELKDRV
jgi:hypothetical protein